MTRLFILLLFFPLQLFSQDRIFNLSYSSEDFIVSSVNGNLLIATRNQLDMYNEDTLKPALPFIPIKIMIANNEDYVGYSFTKKESVFCQNAKLLHNPSGYTADYIPQKPFVFLDNQYEDCIYPNKNIEFIGVSEMRGCKYLEFLICPFRYDPMNFCVYIWNKIQLDIQLCKNNKSQIMPINKSFRDIIKKMVINNDSLDTYYPEKTGGSGTEYLIITCDSFKNEFERLSKWKNIKGVKTQVITIEDICSNNSGSSLSLQQKIRNTISDYFGSDSSLQYVLLAGDDNIVPTKKKEISDATISGLTTCEMPSDLYYACLLSPKRFGWDYTHGDIISSDKLVPDISVTRAPVNTLESTKAFVNRIIKYESNPQISCLNNKILLSGSFGVGLAQHHGDSIYKRYIEGLWSGTSFRFYDTDTDFEEQGGYELNGSHLQQELMKGYPFVFMCSHGDYNRYLLENNTSYTNSFADTLQNIGYTTIATSACYTNRFDNDTTCLSESFIRNPESGLIAYIGHSRQGIVSPAYTPLFSDKFNGLFFQALFLDPSHRIGTAMTSVRVAFTGLIQRNKKNRWVLFGVNPLGDPETPVYVETPRCFDNVEVSYSNGLWSVDAHVDSCDFCAMSIEDEGSSFYDRKYGIRNATYSDLGQCITICIKKAGYIPYVAVVGNNIYVQNKKFDQDIHIFSNNTFIGFDVTENEPYGHVLLNQGALTIQSNNGVTIKNDFEVKKGAVFEIK